MHNITTDSTFLLFESLKTDIDNTRDYGFFEPVDILTCYRYRDVETILQKVTNYTQRGYAVAGYLSFELGYHFLNIKKKRKQRRPLFWFGVFKKYEVTGAGKLSQKISFEEKQLSQPILRKFRYEASFQDYRKKIEKIKRYLKSGDSYQVNYTFFSHFLFTGGPIALYEKIKSQQSVSFSAFLQMEGKQIISLSPELFFQIKKRVAVVKPMKGTFSRGKTNFEDQRNQKKLRQDAKNRAENLMIVDLLRNDLGKVSKSGSVKVKKLFHVEKYPTLFQMTSQISSRLRPGVDFVDFIKAVFPSGSVTGAPKKRTMEIISELETRDRGVYTGAIGFVLPDQTATFSVPIRTMALEGKKGEMGIGSGIVIDSNATSEYQEARLKSKFVRDAMFDFELIETIRWSSRSGFFLLKKHLSRLQRSAEYFGFSFKKQKLNKLLQERAKRFQKKFYKVRVLLSFEGDIKITAFPYVLQRKKQKVCFSKLRTDASDLFYYHKTTKRELYRSQFNRVREKGYFDILFLNQKGNLSEGAISNVFLQKKGKYYTPKLSDGLLPGIYRDYFMNKTNVIEKRLTLDDLKNADRVFLTNSVVGRIEVECEFDRWI